MKKNEVREPKSEQMAICAAPMHRVWQRVQRITESEAKRSRNKQYDTFTVEFEGGEGQRKSHTVVFPTAIAKESASCPTKKASQETKASLMCESGNTPHCL
jgi:hypothetical protein